MRRYNRVGGWTLIELILVVAILAALAAVAIERIIDFRTKAVENSEAYTAAAVQTGINMHHADEIINP